ncbi:hypothetical protein EJC47_11015 [Sphingomonas sp. TF3]|uniref:hypothetical protein n=1 Tax=Sphingomonas sp. TF3 TaxID=2495580 RepID=UPI000F894668|nr:hypothetical protein [Sphingomonas sp. TF3]RUN76494.1 hypothetical protein EJC47_11015 [Sphingomonas sp. TF3]
MITDPNTTFVVRLDTNEMIERERFAALLAAIEEQVRADGFAGPDAVLAVGAVDRGSVEVTVAIVSGVAATLLAIPGFLVALKDLSRQRGRDPNPFAVAVGEVMALDGVMRIDLRHRDTLVTISRDEVPFVQRIAFGSDLAPEHPRTLPQAMPAEIDEEDDLDRVTEDEDQDWVPLLKASDEPPREASEGPSGQVSSLQLVGEFEHHDMPDGTRELRFVPRDTTFAHYFIVVSNTYEAEPMEMVQYQVTGNVTLDAGSPGQIEIVSIAPPDDAMITLRT